MLEAHVTKVMNYEGHFKLNLAQRFSTDANGIAECLGLQTRRVLELEELLKILESKIGQSTLLSPHLI